jgi:hypothetical protein
MALHKDIYWVGRQWAVTGHGVQACDQKQKGKFDIEGARLWEDGVLDGVRALKWLNVEDFDRALEIARKYYPEPPRKAASPKEAIAPKTTESPSPKKGVPRKASALASNDAAPAVSPKPEPVKSAPAKPAPATPMAPKFHLRIEGASAKLLAEWRIRARR